MKIPDSNSATVGAGLTEATSGNLSTGGYKYYIFTAGTGAVTFS